MSQPCFFAHHNATAESTPPDKRTIARSIRLPPSRLCRQPFAGQAANRWPPRVTSSTSPSRSVNASRTNDEIAEIMLPTTSRSLSLIRLRDMCLISRLFELITKTSSISGSGVDGTSSAGGGGAVVVVVGIRLIVTSIFFGASFRPGTRCQRSDDAHAKAKPAPMTRTHPARGVQVVLKLPPAYCPRNCGTGILRFVLAAGGIVNTIANEAYSDEAQEARNAIPA